MKRNRVHVFYLWMWKCEIPVTNVFNSDWFPLYFCMCFWLCFLGLATSLVAQMVKNLPAMQETHVWSLGWEDPLEEGMATHSSILAWRIPWTEEAGWLQSMKSRRVGCNWATDTFLYLDPIFLQWPHLSSFSLVPYAWLYLSPSLFFLSHFLQQILIFEWIFFVRDLLNDYILGFYEMLIKSIDFCEILIFMCHAKKKMEKEAKKRILCFGFNSRGWGTFGDPMGKLLMITLYVLLPLTI